MYVVLQRLDGANVEPALLQRVQDAAVRNPPRLERLNVGQQEANNLLLANGIHARDVAQVNRERAHLLS